EDVAHPGFLEGDSSTGSLLAVLAATPEGRLQPGAATVLRAAERLALSLGMVRKVLLVVPPQESVQRLALGQLLEEFQGDVVVLATSAAAAPPEVESRLLVECWPELTRSPRLVIGEPWTETAFAFLGCRPDQPGAVALRVRRLEEEEGQVILETSLDQGRLCARQTLDLAADVPWWITLAEDAEVPPRVPAPPAGGARVQRWAPRLERFYHRSDIQRLLEELKLETGVVRLADADFIIDVGFGVGNRDGYEAVIEPLEQALRALGVRRLVIGGSRKVTEELHLLPLDRQIGQSGVSVNPQVLLAVGISGAPQHLNYIGPRATVLAFNCDPEAPIMTLNQRQPRPRVFPVVGDLFETVPALTAALRKEEVRQPEKVGGVQKRNRSVCSGAPSELRRG
ncbi:MAG: electron transfer flavoprotein subunit alpha/FixB family protein, partial [Planctomycetes bacterium]|nr:electron transfer flavoprotein subunit alpha/FixB family protein [Planctomycetota bacterium]